MGSFLSRILRPGSNAPANMSAVPGPTLQGGGTEYPMPLNSPSTSMGTPPGPVLQGGGIDYPTPSNTDGSDPSDPSNGAVSPAGNALRQLMGGFGAGMGGSPQSSGGGVLSQLGAGIGGFARGYGVGRPGGYGQPRRTY
jgi:hypothetical protein